MRLHAREPMMNVASADLRDALSAWGKAHPELTSAEYISVVADVLSSDIKSLLKFEIRDERHGNRNKPGGTA